MRTSNGTLSFEQDIKPLFRETDRRAMDFAFDLWDHQDVQENAGSVLDRLMAGNMPCDGGWTEEKIAVFRRWRDAGMPA